MFKTALVALIVVALWTPLEAQEEEQVLGFVIGLGVGMLAPDIRDVQPEGPGNVGVLARLDLGLTIAHIIGVKVALGFSPFEWLMPEGDAVSMSHQFLTFDLFTEVDFGENWRLWPAVGYTLDASITDTQGTGFLTAQGIHAEVGCGYRLNSIMFASLAVGYHFTGGFQAIDIDVDVSDVELGDAPGVSYLDIRAGVVFSLK